MRVPEKPRQPRRFSIRKDKYYVVNEKDLRKPKTYWRFFDSRFQAYQFIKTSLEGDFDNYFVIEGEALYEYNIKFLPSKKGGEKWFFKYRYDPEYPPGSDRKVLRTRLRRWKRRDKYKRIIKNRKKWLKEYQEKLKKIRQLAKR